jgi:transcriptional regulator with XRE-family HTH domain
MQETIGKRIARLRQQYGWTQQDLANRLAISRVAISHIEMDLTLPGERTITLLAGLFKLSPHRLVDGSDYPAAKTDRLPHVTSSYTPLELDVALMNKDIQWLNVLKEIASNPEAHTRLRIRILAEWRSQLDNWSQEWLDGHEQGILAQARRCLDAEDQVS